MKILMTADTLGGVWTYALDLARALGPLSVDVTLATMGALLSREQRLQADAVPNLTVYPSGYKLEWMNDPWEDVHAAGEWLLGLEDLVKPDVVHVNGYAHGALPWKSPVMVVAHSCVLSWWRAVRGEEAPPAWKRYRQAVLRGLEAADMVVAPSGAMLLALVRNYGLLRNARVIHNGRDGSMFAAREKQDFVFAAGRLWDEAKNLAALDKAAEGLPWPVLVAGEQAHPDGGNVPFQHARSLGHLSHEQVAETMGRASIYALPARYEPFGLSALEAAFSGCALVLGDIPSLREIWGDAALFVPPDNVEALRAALLRLIESPTLRQQLAARARLRSYVYSAHHMAEEYCNAYREMQAAGPVIRSTRFAEMASLRKERTARKGRKGGSKGGDRDTSDGKEASRCAS